MSIDDYALAKSSMLKIKFSHLNELIVQFNSLVLRYEDLINHHDQFYTALSSALPLQADVRQKIFDETRTNLIGNPSAHKCSGKIFGFREKLTAATIQTLNNQFAHILKLFNYPLLIDLSTNEGF